MNTKNTDTQIINEEIVVEPAQEPAKIKTPSARDKITADGKVSVLEIILAARYFLPLITTIGFAIALIFEPEGGSFLDKLVMVFAIIGWISALTVSPIKMLKFVLKSIATGFKIVRGFIPYYGVADLVAAVIGVGLGFIFSVGILAFFPAIFTITKFFNEDKF